MGLACLTGQATSAPPVRPHLCQTMPHRHRPPPSPLPARWLALLVPLALAACSSVQPWEKGVLAKPEMGFEGDRLEALFIEHLYASKEAASGGSGVGGGGCGCN